MRLNRLIRWCRALWRKDEMERELDEEVRYHLEREIELNLRDGMSPEEARAAALRAFGGVERAKEECREARGVRLIEDLWQDLRYGLRMLFKNPSFSLIAVSTLGVGIGASTAIFSVVNAVILRSLPYEEPEQLVMMWESNPAQGRDSAPPSPGNILDWRERGQVFAGVATWFTTSLILRDDALAEEITAARVTSDFFPVLKAEALIGRTFLPGEVDGASYSAAGRYVSGNRVVVISHSFWRRHFGADPGVIGHTITLNGDDWRVVGVMPETFGLLTREASVWMPWDMAHSYSLRLPGGPPRDFRFLPVVARLKPGVTIEQAQIRMASVAAGLEEQHPKTNKGWGVRVAPLRDELLKDSGLTLLILFGAVGFLLLIACANVANLLLARAATRRHEMAVRSALGATRRRLARQVLTESLLLSLVGGGFGLLLAFFGTDFLVALAPRSVPRLGEVAIDAKVLTFTLGLIVLTGLLFGLAPALRASRTGLVAALGEGGRKGGRGAIRGRVRNLLIVAQLGVTLTLLVGAGLAVRSFLRLSSVDPGFNPDNLLVLRVALDANTYKDDGQVTGYYQRLLSELRSLPGVQAAGAVTRLPMSSVGSDASRPYWRPDAAPSGGGAPTANVRMATPDYFKALGQPLLKGRTFDEHMAPDSGRVVIINESLARGLWPHEDPVGRQLVIDYRGGAYPYQVIGVVGDTRHYGLRSTPNPEIFIPHAQNPFLVMSVAVRTSGSPLLLVKAVREKALQTDPSQPVHSVLSMDELIAESVATELFSMWLLGAFAALALALSVVGVYGTIAYMVAQRTQEIGVRLALGARPVDVFRLIIGQGMRITLIGVAVGLLGAAALTRLMVGALFGVSPLDPPTFAGVTLLLVAVSLLACAIPARRATKVDPIIALRYE